MANKKGKVVDQYAKALLAYGADQDSFDSLLADLKVVTQVVESTPKLTALLAAQTISEEDQVSLLDTLTKGANQAVVNLTKILLSHHHFALLGAVTNRFIELYQQSQGIEPVVITSAVAVDDEQKGRLEQAFLKQSGAKTVEATYQINPDLVAGVSMQSKSILIDGSLKTKIAKLKAELLG
ncbi:ATP synthase F1 subunit delta [Fructobacillus fructosus]|uniref:ATP synthase subunit delta n=1 Tax=Fructobacillus fructosus TaxID=1631 RepID=A0ABM9MPK6_9LACO|nr:ATP synthase F1 subunit delta [Fructobacillus fructosus]MBC9118741.1 F0F1 ATP synthase subunit delta [Fructobacillus fructosus]MBD9365405.1 F0F1 ATP synthase subunit delta [Leuconostoc mesenteroides]MCK8637894.1 F0F1 ATP synthase subunit delta [Fructobacillus fructosus]CAK1231138.1 FoF1-type ATP synthase [Fructobacillus fructosus]